MAEQTVLFVLLPLDPASPLAWCTVSADSETEARAARGNHRIIFKWIGLLRQGRVQASGADWWVGTS